MTSKEDLIGLIIKIEWEMFQNVQNAGGTAACQEDPTTFEIMRYSQAMSWSEAALESYLGDLIEAQQNHRNLLTEKYAWMMQSTLPQEYAAIQHLLPPLDPETVELMEQIMKIVLAWSEELSVKYPYVLGRGRPIHSSEDTPVQTSIETYLRGELATFSRKTLQLYHEHVSKLQSDHVNGSEITLEYTTRQYGYSSLTEANEKLSARRTDNL